MAESADIITDDDQTVLLPSMEASCPMAGMAEALQVDAAWDDSRGVVATSTVRVATKSNAADVAGASAPGALNRFPVGPRTELGATCSPGPSGRSRSPEFVWASGTSKYCC